MRYRWLIFAAMAVAGCGGDLNVDSCWRNVDVIIDGNNSEWAGCATYLEDKNFAVGVMNDTDFLYVSLSTADREVQRQVMMSGLTVWLDVTNDKQKRFGIRFPLGLDRPGIRREMRESAGSSGPPDRLEMQKRFAERLASMDQYQIIGPSEGNLRLMSASDSETIVVKVGMVNGAFVYELRVPLRTDEDYLYGLNVGPGDVIAIGIDSPKFEPAGMRAPHDDMDVGMGDRGMSGGRGGGGMPPGGWSGGDSSRTRPDWGSFERPEPFEVWAHVTLVSAAGAQPN
ncbi:MAG: hypothetical protein P8181_13730 [bacterium]